MKVISAIVLVVFSLSCLASTAAMAASDEVKGAITISGAWAIYPTVVAWAESFQKRHPGAKIDVSAGGAGKGAAEAISGLVDIGMVSREPDPSEIAKGIVPVYILHDAVFPVVSEKNPALDGLLAKGVKKDIWTGIYIKGTVTTWDDVIGKALSRNIHVYTRSDACGAAASWAAYMGKKQEDLKGIGVYGDPGLLEASTKDPLGLGFSNFSYVFTSKGTVVNGVKLVPIDSNGNGIADPDEIYNDRASAINAIRAGKYPATRKNYLFVKGKPKGLVKDFIEFALSEEGTKIVDATGASLSLDKDERARVVESIK